MNNVIALPGSDGWIQRKAVGDAHEARVRDELEARGWSVRPYGQALFTEQIRQALKRTDSDMRWDPDMVAARDSTICFVEAKASMQGPRADTYRLSRKSLRASLRLWIQLDLPVYYVFENLGVATPADVMQFCGLTHLGATGGYVSFSAALPMPFELVFGAPRTSVMSATIPRAA